LEVIGNLAARYKNLLVLLTGPARGYVKQGLKRLGVPYVHYFLSGYHKILRYYHALNLYIITSRSEGGPKALLESWATGVPVVSTPVGMAVDIIQHGKNGLLSESGDVKSLTDQAIQLIENTGLHNSCRRQALEDVKLFDWPLIAEQYYKQLYYPFLK
jgi:glycosyltransferase involved in cell wall biosynthesis